jgi:hypothetical protein
MSALPKWNTEPDPDAEIDGPELENRPQVRDEMLYGLVGEFAREAARNSEAIPAAVALMALTYIGAHVGRGAFMRVGDVTHHPRLFVLHVAGTNSGKGESRELLMRVDRRIRAGDVPGVDATFLGKMHTGGLSTREGIAALIPDRIERDGKVIIEGTADKRLLVHESEFSGLLRTMRREGNAISSALRDAWDGVAIAPLTKTNPTQATDPHIALWGSITPGEMRALFDPGDVANGFLNRILIVHAESDRDVTWPTPVPDEIVFKYAERFIEVIKWGRDRYPAVSDTLEISLSNGARQLHERAYRKLKRASPDPMLGALLARARSHVLRLAMLFAICDMSQTVEEHHYRAAMAWIQYWTGSVRYLFRRGANEAKAVEAANHAEKILEKLHESPEQRLTRTQISAVFNRNLSRDGIDRALDALLARNPCPVRVWKDTPKEGSVASTQWISLKVPAP